MKIHRSIYKILFYLILVIQIWIPILEVSVLISLITVFFLLADKKVVISKPTFNIVMSLTFILIFGVIVSLFNSYKLYDIIKDLAYFVRPILNVLAGYLLARKINNVQFIIKSIVYVSLFFSAKHLITLGFSEFEKGTVEEIRKRGGFGSFIEVLGLVILITKNKFPNFKVFTSKLKSNTIFFIIIFSSILYFSRTMILGLLVFLITMYGFTKLTTKAINYITIFSVLLGLFYGYLFSIKLDPDKAGLEDFLFKLKNAPAEVFSAPEDYNPKNHKDLFKHWRAYEASRAFKEMKPINYIFGKGFGSLIDLKFKAPIGGEDGLRFIPHIHNGYMYVFFKTGIIGLFFYLVILIILYRKVYVISFSKNETALLRMVSGIGLYFIFSSLIITGMYNVSEESVFCLGVFLLLIKQEINNN